MAAGCEDSTIKVKKLNQPDDFIELKGQKGTIMHIDLHPQKSQLAASSGDGTINVWNIDSKEILKTFEGLTKNGEFADAKIFNTPSFEKSGRYMAYPSGKSINVVDTNDWDVKFKLENADVENEYSICSFSHCGTYLAAGTTKGEIAIWKMASKEPIKGEIQGEDIYAITAIEWNPKDKEEFAFVDLDGQLSTATIKLTKPSEVSDVEMNGVEENIDDPDDIYGGIDYREDEADEDVDNENCIALEKLKNETLRNEPESDDDMKSVKSVKSYSPVPYKKFQVQLPFQPGSTPDNLEHRFMMWNHVGQVICHLSDDENSIIVEFHDATVHSSLHIINTLNHQLASLSTTCLALATKETPCKLVCIALQSGGGREWSATMPDCEEIIGIATGDAFVAVATSADYIRLFTTMGTQREVISVPGLIVCTSALGNKLVVVYHTSETSNKYSIMVITILGLVMSNRTIELPMSNGSKLAWIGFSDVGSIISYESCGRVMSYNIKRNLWMPICDLNEHVIGASDSFFIVSVSERAQKIRATLCRGTSYPLTNPRPILREIDYLLPLCHMETEKSKLEEALIRATAFELDSSDKAVVEKALKLFSTAMTAELESRAFEIVELIGEKKLIELAAKYSSQKGRMHLTGKILKLLEDHEEKHEEKLSIANSLEKDERAYSEIYEKTPLLKEDNIPQSTPIIAPRPMISQKRSNPFAKKPLDKGNSSHNALNHLTKKSIGYNESITHSDDENVPSNNSSLLSNKSISKDTPRPGNFSQWFIANKESLKTDNPSASDTELLRIGKQVYKELTHNESVSVASSAPLNKRKLDLNDDGGSAKLAKYVHTE